MRLVRTARAPLVRSTLLLLAGLTVAGTAGPLGAQTGSDTGTAAAEARPVERADSLLSDLVVLSDSSLAMSRRIQGSVGEDRALLGQRIRRVLDDAHELSDEITGIMAELDRSDPGVQAFFDRLLSEMRRRNSDLRSLISTVRSDVDVADQARDTVSAEGLVAFDDLRLGRSLTLDQTLTALYENTRTLGRMGGDTIPGWRFLDPILEERAEDLATRIEFRREQVASLEEEIARAGEAAPAELQLSLDSHQRGLERNLTSLQVTTDLLEERGREVGRYREVLVLSGGGITTDILNPSILSRLLRRGWNALSEWVLSNVGNWAVRVLVFVLIVGLFWGLGRVTRRIVRRAVARSSMDLSLLFQQTLITWVGRLVLLLGVLIALGQVGVNLAPVLAGLGVAGFVVGFALQDTLGNFAAGVMILVYRPYDVDDVVEVGGVFGKVGSMSLVSTTINTLDNQRLVVPNGKIWGEVIRNVTAQKLRRVDLTFGIGYSDDIPKAEGILRRLVEEHPATLDDPEPVIKVHNLGDSSVDIIVRPWCKTEDYWDVHWDLTRGVKLAFDAEGVSIPFPQRDVHLYTESPDGPPETAGED